MSQRSAYEDLRPPSTDKRRARYFSAVCWLSPLPFQQHHPLILWRGDARKLGVRALEVEIVISICPQCVIKPPLPRWLTAGSRAFLAHQRIALADVFVE